nr:MAG TPA: hypothetical protein [Caudoviricetes sp.]
MLIALSSLKIDYAFFLGNFINEKNTQTDILTK